ncbi:MAG: hypothetical protein ACK5HR_00525, partial [Mycoplasmatales bacterium]
MSPEKVYYGTTSYIVIPLSSNYHEDLQYYKVQIMTDKIGYALIYNFGLTTRENLRVWRDKKTKKAVYITKEELKKIIDKLNNMILVGGRMTLEDLKKRPYLDEMIEKIQLSNEELKKDNISLKLDNQELKVGNQELKAGNQELKLGNQELKAGNQELRNNNQKLDVK